MGKPNESLDNDVVKHARETTLEPPRSASPGLADEPEAGEDREVSEPGSSTFLLWVHRFVAVGSVVAMIAFILLGALSVVLNVSNEPASERNATTNEPPAEEPEAATNVEHADEPEATTNGQYADEPELMTSGQPADEETETKERPRSFSASKSARASITRSNARRRRARQRFRVAGYMVKRPPSRQPKPLESLFIPTTLVIYVENGVIKTRIEPWLRATPTPNN